MFIGKIKFHAITHGVNDVIFKLQHERICELEEETETLREIQRFFWEVCHKNLGPWHSNEFVNGQITDTSTGITWKCDSYGRKKIGGNNMRKLDMTDVKEAGNFIRPTAGAYICVITDVVDIPEKEYLKVSYDHADGEFKGYYAELRKKFPDWDWCGAYCKSYKQAALPMFKRFCSAVSRSNGNFVFDANKENAEEKTLIGKRIGLVFQEEEYYGNDGSIRTRLIVAREFPIDKLDSQKVPEPKKLNRVPADEFKPIEVEIGIDEELPFA